MGSGGAGVEALAPSSRDARGASCLANAHGATAVMWLMSDPEALVFIAIVALMLAVAVVLVIL